MFSNNAIRPNLAVESDLCCGMNYCRWMNHNIASMTLTQEAVPWILKFRRATFSCLSHHERYFRFADDFTPHFADSFCLADLAANLSQLDIDDQRVPRLHGFSPFDVFSGHEISELAAAFGAAQHQEPSYLCDGFKLKYTRHDRMSGKVALKVRFIYRNVLEAHNVVTFDEYNPIHHQERITMREKLHQALGIHGPFPVSSFVRPCINRNWRAGSRRRSGGRRGEGLGGNERFAHLCGDA